MPAARSPRPDGRRRRPVGALAAALALGTSLLATAPPADAAFPPGDALAVQRFVAFGTITVGATEIGVTAADLAAPEDGPQLAPIRLDRFVVYPSCAAVTDELECVNPDPGVFRLGTSAVIGAAEGEFRYCPGVGGPRGEITVSITTEASGAYVYTPVAGPTPLLQTAPGGNDQCSVEHHVEVLRMPVHDASSSIAGIQSRAVIYGDFYDTETGEVRRVGATQLYTVNPATPTLTGTASPGGLVGTLVSDTAVLSGGVAPTGTITFRLYGPGDDDCTGPAVERTLTVEGPGSYTPGAVAPAAGTYRWVAAYSGDRNNAPVSTPCSAPQQQVTIEKFQPTITAVASPGGPLDTAVTATATLTGAFGTPAGAVTFALHGPGDDTCSAAPVATVTGELDGTGTATSDPVVPTEAGTYRWVATFPGDGDNHAAVSGCTEAAAAVVLTPRTPTALLVDPVVMRLFPLQLNYGFVRARLTAGGAPLAGQLVAFAPVTLAGTAGAVVCVGTTDAAGVATCQPPLLGLVTLLLGTGVEARFAGAPTFAPTTGRAGLYG